MSEMTMLGDTNELDKRKSINSAWNKRSNEELMGSFICAAYQKDISAINASGIGCLLISFICLAHIVYTNMTIGYVHMPLLLMGMIFFLLATCMMLFKLLYVSCSYTASLYRSTEKKLYGKEMDKALTFWNIMCAR